MERVRMESLRRKLVKPTREIMNDIAQQICREGRSFPKEILDLFSEPLRDGMWIDLTALQAAVIAAHDRDLYFAAKPFLLTWDRLIEWLRAELPDANIEDQLCDELWKCTPGSDNDNVRRRYITEGLKDCGTLGCLDALEAFNYELSPRFSTAQAVQDAIRGAQASDSIQLDANAVIDALMRRVDIEYGRLLKEAISAVRGRNRARRDAWNVSEKLDTGSDLFKTARLYIQEAELLCESKMGAALNEVRKATEAMLKEALTRKGITSNAKGTSIEGFVLGALITLAEEKLDLKDITKKCLDLIRIHTNTGSHDQGLSELEYLRPETVRGSIAQYRVVEGHIAKLFADASVL